MRKKLTHRLYQLVELIAAGHNTAEIANIMEITESSIKVYTSEVYERLDLKRWGNSRVRLVNMFTDEQDGGLPLSIEGYEFPIGV